MPPRPSGKSSWVKGLVACVYRGGMPETQLNITLLN